ncbi:hypothetical protein ACWDUX_30330 [Streptomyces sp. NPDC003444]
MTQEPDAPASEVDEVSEVSEVSEVDEANEVNVPSISDTLLVVQEMDLATSTREEIDSRIEATKEHLALLMDQDLPYDSDAQVRELYRTAYRLLELNRRPTPESHAFYAFNYLKDMASVLIGFLAAYEREAAKRRHERAGREEG